MAEEYWEIPITKLKRGMVLSFPVLDSGTNVLLLGTGTTVTNRVLDLLSQRGIEKIRVHVKDLAKIPSEGEDGYAPVPEPVSKYYKRLEPPPARRRERKIRFRSAASLRMDEEITAGTTLGRTLSGAKVFLRPRRRATLEEWYKALRAFETDEQSLVERCDRLQQDMSQRSRLDAEPVMLLIERQLQLLGRDWELLCLLPHPPANFPYPARHSLRVARMSMVLAAHLGWRRDEIFAVGLGAFCHDVGMLRLPEKLLRGRTRLTPFDRHDLAKHPVFSLDLVSENTQLPDYVRYIVYQAHERCDGSGYPRACDQETIHPAARLVGLVDAFVGMVSVRPHRPALLPHQAILEVMQQTHHGLWDAEMTGALLRAVSLYPLGSFVELSDGRLGRSIHTNEEDNHRPVLEVWIDPAAIAHEPGEILDLLDNAQITVLRAVRAPQIL